MTETSTGTATGSETKPATCPVAHDRVPLYTAEFAADPARFYTELRKRGPIVPVELAPGVPASLVVSYEVALQVLRNPNTFPRDARNWQGTVPPDSPVLPMMAYREMCLFTDGQTHTRLRQAVTDSLARLDLNALRAHIEQTADTLIAELAPDGTAELVAQYARPLTLLVVCGMFGCPPDLGDRMLGNMSRMFEGKDAEQANADLTQCLFELVTVKRRQPGEDVTSWLMAHPAEMTDEEMVQQLAQVMGSATEPGLNLIANTLRLLLSDDRFATDLTGGSMPIQDALDEVLWTDPPLANFGNTYPTRDLDIAGVHLPANQPVVISFAAANNDPSLIADNRVGNRAHLAFSLGPHACPAQSHARLIASVAIEKILDALPGLELSIPADQIEWRIGPFHRALSALPVQFPPVTMPTQSPGPTRRLRAVPTTQKFQEPSPGLLRRALSSITNWWHGQ